MTTICNDSNCTSQCIDLGINFEPQSRRDSNCVKVKSLKEVLAEKIPFERENVRAFRESHGSAIVGEITVDMVR